MKSHDTPRSMKSREIDRATYSLNECYIVACSFMTDMTDFWAI
jgi:hypothetical protein